MQRLTEGLASEEFAEGLVTGDLEEGLASAH